MNVRGDPALTADEMDRTARRDRRKADRYRTRAPTGDQIVPEGTCAFAPEREESRLVRPIDRQFRERDLHPRLDRARAQREDRNALLVQARECQSCAFENGQQIPSVL